MTQNTPMNTPFSAIDPELQETTQPMRTIPDNDLITMIAILEANKTTVEELRLRLSTPLFTVENVHRFLNQCSSEELAILFYKVGLQKILETHINILKENAQQQSNQQAQTNPAEAVPDDGKPSGLN